MSKKKSKNKKNENIKEKEFQVNAFSVLSSLSENLAKKENKKETNLASSKPKPPPTPAPEQASMRNPELFDGRTDEEIFLDSVGDIKRINVLHEKFKEKEKLPHDADRKTSRPSLSEDELEFAIFTSEMVRSGVKRLDTPKVIKDEKSVPKCPPPRPAQVKSIINEEAKVSESVVSEPKILKHDDSQSEAQTPAVTKQSPELKSNLEKNNNEIKAQSGNLTKNLRSELSKEQSRFGTLNSLKLNKLTISAAILRVEDYFSALQASRAKFGHILVGDGFANITKDEIFDALYSYLTENTEIEILNETKELFLKQGIYFKFLY